MDDLHIIAQKKEEEMFAQSLGYEQDPMMLVLRAHLYTENMLERLIVAKLPRGDKVRENGTLTYHQKLVLVEAFDCLKDNIASSLRQLNKLRNQCAHELHRSISSADIDRVGSPLGKAYTEFKREAKFEETKVLRSILHYVCGYLGAEAFIAEHPDLLGVAPQIAPQKQDQKPRPDRNSKSKKD